MNYDVAIFDLDGTIIESGEGIINSFKYAFKKMDFIPSKEFDYSCLIGPPLRVSIPEYCNFDTDLTEKTIGFYWEYYLDKGMYECKLYEGIKECFEQLRKLGIKMAIATSKPYPVTMKVLHSLNIEKYFSVIAAPEQNVLESKADQIKKVIDNYLDIDPKKMIMIGDRMFDINGAAENEIDSVGVLYGYGSLDELTQAGATFTVNDVTAINHIIGAE